MLSPSPSHCPPLPLSAPRERLPASPSGACRYAQKNKPSPLLAPLSPLCPTPLQVRAELRSLRRTGCSFEPNRPQGGQQGRGQLQGGGQQQRQKGEEQQEDVRPLTSSSGSSGNGIGGVVLGAGSRGLVSTSVSSTLGPARSLLGTDHTAAWIASLKSAPATNGTAAAAAAAAAAAVEGTAWHRTAGIPSWDGCFRCHFLSCGRYSGPYNAKV